MTGHTIDHVLTTVLGTDPSPSTTDAAQEDAYTGQDHTANPTTVEAPATNGDIHPIFYPTTAVAHDTHQLNDALGNTLAEKHCTITTATSLRHATFPARLTLKTILWTKAVLV